MTGTEGTTTNTTSGGSGTAAAAAATTQKEIADVLQERLIDSEYKIWKKNTPYLYVLLFLY
jgi:hypothetical protein